MNLFLERLLELLLRRDETNLTPERIRYALAQIHSIYFDASSEGSDGKMPSVLTEDAEKIFRVLGISNERCTTMGPNVVPEFFIHK